MQVVERTSKVHLPDCSAHRNGADQSAVLAQRCRICADSTSGMYLVLRVDTGSMKRKYRDCPTNQRSLL